MSPYNKATLPSRILVFTCALIFVLIVVVDIDEPFRESLRILSGTGAMIALIWFQRVRRRFEK